MVFIESAWFSRRLHELAGGKAYEVLRAIQNDLLDSPSREGSSQVWEELGKDDARIRAVRKAKGVGAATFICSYLTKITFTSCSLWINMSKKI